MKLSGLHLLLTYQCIFECDHCFVWSSPSQCGTFNLTRIQSILDQADDLGTVSWIYFEGGEPFLYYGLLLEAVRQAAERGYSVGIVSNGYWATGLEDARAWLKPFSGLIQDLSISSDLYHYDEKLSQQARWAQIAAESLNLPVGLIGIAQPENFISGCSSGQIDTGESSVMYRGRAAVKLVSRAVLKSPEHFSLCPYEDLREPGRIHIDPFGYTHICQGISLGNVFQASLKELCSAYKPEAHPICGPLLRGGPIELARQYNLPLEEGYADACHLCYTVRLALRPQLPDILAPGNVYVGQPAPASRGVIGSNSASL